MRRMTMAAALSLAACGGHNQGGLGERCGPNKSCNAGLYCDVDTCIAALVDAAVRDIPEGIDGPIDGRPDLDAPSPLPDAASNNCAPRIVPANQAHIHSSGASTHAGESCMTSGCHLGPLTGFGAPAFDVAGTVYGSNGQTPNPGATIRLTDSGGTTKALTTDTAGTFYLLSGAAFLAFPVKVVATVCPTVTQMTGQLQSSSDGNCSRGGCHGANSAAGQIKLEPTH